MENLFANTGIGKHIIRTHHWGIVLPTLEKAEAFMKTFGLQEDYSLSSISVMLDTYITLLPRYSR